MYGLISRRHAHYLGKLVHHLRGHNPGHRDRHLNREPWSLGTGYSRARDGGASARARGCRHRNTITRSHLAADGADQH